MIAMEIRDRIFETLKQKSNGAMKNIIVLSTEEIHKR